MDSSKHILIVDDEKRMRNILSNILTVKGYFVYDAEDGDQGLEILKKSPIDAVLLDLMMPEKNGLEVLKEIHDINPAIPVIMISAYGSVPTAVDAIKQGAYDFVEKPLDADKILVVIKNAVEKHSLSKENLQLRQKILERYKMVGKSPAIKKVFQQIKLLAYRDCTALITGESGTGKELVARALHSLSERVAKPFIKVNCAALPHELIESELFGHKKGAFTGALQDQTGKFEAAQSGTLFLDEIGELSAAVQAKLLQVLEEKRFHRLGDHAERQVDVRLIAATHRNLKEEIDNDRFREDLFYRLNTTSIHLPPLRERPEDIPELVHYFIPRLCDELNLPLKEIPAEAIAPFLEYHWPGNVRELKHRLQEMLIYHQGAELEKEYVQEWLVSDPSEENFVTPSTETALRTARANFERDYIRKALIAHDWNIPAAAQYLGIERTNLYRKMKQLGVEK